MTKFVLLLVFTLVGYGSTYAQEKVVIQVIDGTSKAPLAFANVYEPTNDIGGTTDLNGYVELIFEQGITRPLSVECSFIGYRNKPLLLRDDEERSYVVELDFTSNMLQEITIKAQSQLHLDPIILVKNAIKSVKKNYVNSDFSFAIGYIEVLVEEEKIIESSEAIATIQYSGYPQKIRGNKSLSTFYEDIPMGLQGAASRSTSNMARNYNCQFYKYHNSLYEKCNINAARFSSNHSKYDFSTMEHGGPLDLTTMDKVKYGYDFLDKKLISKYQYSLRGLSMIDGEEFAIISFKPKPESKRIIAPWNKKMGHAILSGTMLISTKSYVIKSFSCQMTNISNNESYEIGQPWQDFPISNTIEVIYKKSHQGRYAIHTVTTNQKLKSNQGLICTVVRSLVRIPEDASEKVVPATVIGRYFYNNWDCFRNYKTPLYRESDWTEYDKIEIFSSVLDSWDSKTISKAEYEVNARYH